MADLEDADDERRYNKLQFVDQMMGIADDRDNDGDDCYEDYDERLQKMNPLQKCCVGIGMTILCLYFIPMLSCIPLAIIGGGFGGRHMTNPYAPGYNNITATHVSHHHVRRPTEAAAPTYESSGSWYWDLPTVCGMVFIMPLVLLTVAYHVKVRISARATDRAAKAGLLVQ
eukprot:gnl/TRDRNA2_/TRDRNA2_186103_c0_seq1.p1 gnl/TRDRNA2_/TRDRNA2_186103_c0~~gnl/TRDRNA2_/TRDRNA2_186103_c0_seq1.p1  ORF type:complete len:171 (+),score=23.95 gnl/TRDRNA2_/TRDRNA2_186103_c0_seq1:108-620(+)